ncbi:MAG: hypothetical protein L0I76_30985 [Pseudonocardia sp.]|nr:hypothetical protein [Pseudonocardia sp.]
MGPYPVRFRVRPQLVAAALPDCACGHRADLHGLLVQHVGGSGCFRAWWKENALGSLSFAGGCDCTTYRPVAELLPRAVLAQLPGVILTPAHDETENRS